MEAFPSQNRKEIKIESIEAETISNDLNYYYKPSVILFC